MKKLGLLVKEISEKKIKDTLKQTGSVLVVNYSGLSSPAITALRQSLKASRSDIFVVKNSVARRALKEIGFDSVLKSIEGPCGLVFIGDDPVEASKALCTFAKDHEQLKVAAGLIQDRVMEKKDIEALAKLPPKEVLRAQAVIALKSPITGLVMTLHGTLRKFVICIEQIRQKKGN